jgi:hypothetical protein
MNPNASDQTRQRSPWLDRVALCVQLFFAAIFLVVGPLLLVNMGLQAIQAVHSSSWPSVDGVVTESRIDHATDIRGRKTDMPKITYRYSVDGVEHVGSRLFFGSQYSESWTAGAKWTAHTQEYIARYPTGTPLQVHYDPDHAATSVVEAGVASALVTLIVVATMATGVGVFAAFLAARQVRASASTTSMSHGARHGA